MERYKMIVKQGYGKYSIVIEVDLEKRTEPYYNKELAFIFGRLYDAKQGVFEPVDGVRITIRQMEEYEEQLEHDTDIISGFDYFDIFKTKGNKVIDYFRKINEKIKGGN